MNPADVTYRRMQVLELRIRLELVAATAYDQVCKSPVAGAQDNIRKRLLFLMSYVPHDRYSETYGLVNLGRHVYARTSDVLHGRTNMINIPQVVIDEWRKIVEDLEAFLDGGQSYRNSCTQIM